MFDKSRSSWLKQFQETSPLRRNGRKMFNIHKNIESPIRDYHVLRYSKTPIRYTNFRENQKNTDLSLQDLTPKISSNIKLLPIDEWYYKKQLMEKDLEIHLLKNQYKNNTNNLISLQAATQDTQKKPLNSISRLEEKKYRRTPDPQRFNGYDDFAKRILDQRKFTKSNPKIVFSNPITGIPFSKI